MPRKKNAHEARDRARLQALLGRHPGLKSELARQLNVTRQAISDWPRIPLDRLVDVERISGIPREQLRPEIFRRR